jgi:hypothetical protein
MIAGFCVRPVSGRNILLCSGPIADGNDKKATAGFRTPARSRKSMIRKSGYRFSLGTNAKRLPGDHAQTKKIERDDDSKKSHPALAANTRRTPRA